VTQLKQQQKKNPFAAFLPVIGLVLVLALGFISYVFAPSVNRWLDAQFRGWPPAGTSEQTLIIMTTVFMTVIMTFLVGSVVAMFAPRKKSAVKDDDLRKERKASLKEKKDRKKRRKKINKAAEAQRKQSGE
jgi:uncharacterized BrkB/YihY/UPF0761 family membrane protein